MRTLVIEDGLCSAELTQKHMEAYGECDVAYTGEAGMDKYYESLNTNNPYALILLDITLPVMDGYQVLHKIRMYEEKNELYGEDSTKILMLSAHNDHKTIMRAFREQCEGYVIKPVTKEKILKCLKEIEMIK